MANRIRSINTSIIPLHVKVDIYRIYLTPIFRYLCPVLRIIYIQKLKI